METTEAENFLIREVSIHDCEELNSLLQATGVFQPHEIEIANEVIRESFQSSSTYNTFCMLDEKEQLLGYVCWGATPCTSGTFDLYWIAVHPKFQGEGVGKQLLAFAEDHVKKNRGRLMLIETSSQPAYEATRRFYLKNGYKQLAIVPEFYRQGDDKIIYGKTFLP